MIVQKLHIMPKVDMFLMANLNVHVRVKVLSLQFMLKEGNLIFQELRKVESNTICFMQK